MFTPQVIDIALTAFVTMFVIIDPLGLLPIFIGLTQDTPASYKRRMAIKGVLIGGTTLLFFAFLGDRFLGLLGVNIASFRIAGGVMLFVTALEMVFEKRTKRRENEAEKMKKEIKDEGFDDISVFPLSIPLISGPGAVTSIMLLMSANRDNPVHMGTVLAVLVAVLLIVFILFMLAPRLEKLMGPTFTQIISRVLGVILGALAVQYIIDGIRVSFFT